ncbi:hypothetical protein MKW15_15145 [Gordonia sp. ABSL49_1]|nr:hypothetical protein [Gordonia sp. ABSL49_1]MCH5643971.1 hypothetical protein [Gordonia sp. ABSL49_1]
MPRLAGWSLITSGVLFAIGRQGVSHEKVALYATIVFGALLVVRVAYYAMVRRRRRASSHNRLRAAIVGGGVVAVELIESTLEQPELGVDVVLAVSDDPMPELSGTGVPIESGVTEIRKLAIANDLDAVIVSFSCFPDSRLVGPLRECDELDLTFITESDIGGRDCADLRRRLGVGWDLRTNSAFVGYGCGVCADGEDGVGSDGGPDRAFLATWVTLD